MVRESHCPLEKAPRVGKDRVTPILRAMTEPQRRELGMLLRRAGHALELPFWGNAVQPLTRALALLLFVEEEGR